MKHHGNISLVVSEVLLVYFGGGGGGLGVPVVS